MEKKFFEESFTAVYDSVISSEKLNGNDKLFTSYILRWQINDEKVCYMSNQALGKKFGLGLTAIKEIISRLKGYGFLKSKDEQFINDVGNWTSTRELTIDKDKLKAFLEAEQAAIAERTAKAVAAKKEAKLASKAKAKPAETVTSTPELSQTAAPSTDTTCDSKPAAPPIPTDDGAAPRTKADAFNMIRKILEGQDFSGPDRESIQERILSEIESHVVLYKFKEHLAVWLDEYIGTYLLTVVPPKRKVETQDEWLYRKMSEQDQQEYAGVEYGSLDDAWDNL